MANTSKEGQEVLNESNIKNNKGEELTDENISEIANNMMAHLVGLNKPAVDFVMKWIENSLNSCYFLSNPKELRKS